jgi:tetratricopeptide (TPR) repeat protein
LREQRALNFYNQGLHLWNLGKYLAAEPYFVKAFAVSPDADNGTVRTGYCAVKSNIGNDFLSQKNYPKAYQYFQAAQSACSSDPTYQNNLDLLEKHIRYQHYDAIYQGYKNQQKVSINRIGKTLDDFAATHDNPVSTFDFAPMEDSLRISKGSQHSAPVDVRDLPENSGKKQIDPAPRQKGFKMKDVPLPPDIVEYYRTHDPFGGGPQGPTKTMDLILDALQVGHGSLEDSLLYLQKRVREEGESRHGTVALSYLEGLSYGAIGYAESQPTEQQVWEKEVTELFLNGASSIIPDWHSELEAGISDTQDDAWLRERMGLVKDAIAQGNGDLYKSLKYLEQGRLKHSIPSQDAVRSSDVFIDIIEDHVGWSAYYYILGLSTYPGLKSKEDWKKLP